MEKEQVGGAGHGEQDRTLRAGLFTLWWHRRKQRPTHLSFLDVVSPHPPGYCACVGVDEDVDQVSDPVLGVDCEFMRLEFIFYDFFFLRWRGSICGN